MRQSVTIKVESGLVQEVEQMVKDGFYETKSDVFRDAIRDKIQEYKRNKALAKFEKLRGIGKKWGIKDQITEEDGERAFLELEKELKERSQGSK